MHTHTHVTQFPEHPYGDLLDKLLLFKHNGENVLIPLTDEDPIEDGTIIDIVLKGNVLQKIHCDTHSTQL